jgi:hypothetical protein
MRAPKVDGSLARIDDRHALSGELTTGLPCMAMAITMPSPVVEPRIGPTVRNRAAGGVDEALRPTTPYD